MALSPEGRRSRREGNLRAGSEPEPSSAHPGNRRPDAAHQNTAHQNAAHTDPPESDAPYPTRDFLCLDCVVPGGCKPYASMCLWRADRSEAPNAREVQLLRAVQDLAWRRRIPSVREVARRMGISPTAVSARIERAVEAGLLVRGCEQHDDRGVSLTALGEERLADLGNRRPELVLNQRQCRYYHLLATVRDLQATGAANRHAVRVTTLASALRRRRHSVLRSVRALAELALVRHERGCVELTEAGRHLLETLRAYTVNVRLGPRLVIRARGRLRTRYLCREKGRAVMADRHPADKHPGDVAEGEDGALPVR